MKKEKGYQGKCVQVEKGQRSKCHVNETNVRNGLQATGQRFLSFSVPLFQLFDIVFN